MKAENINKAYSIAQNIRELQKQKDLVAGVGSALGITIQSTYQDRTFVDAIRPSVLQELDRRIEEEMGALSELGVSFP